MKINIYYGGKEEVLLTEIRDLLKEQSKERTTV